MMMHMLFNAQTHRGLMLGIGPTGITLVGLIYGDEEMMLGTFRK